MGVHSPSTLLPLSSLSPLSSLLLFYISWYTDNVYTHRVELGEINGLARQIVGVQFLLSFYCSFYSPALARQMTKIKKCTGTELGMLLCSFFALFASVGVYADGFVIPSITIAGVHDDNIFVTAGTQDKDTITRISPGLEFGYVSPGLTMRANYTQDMESYKEHSELDSDSMRQFADAAIDYQASATLRLTFDADYTLSQVLSDLNLNTGGFGTGRSEGERTTATPGMEYRFSETAIGRLDYTWTSEKLVDGLNSTIDQINTEYENALNNRNRFIVGYSYSQYEFTNGLTQRVHTPRVGIIHEFSERTMITAEAGPRIEEDSVDVNAGVILSHTYSAGQVTLRYERDVTTLIGEAGIVQAETIGGTLLHRLGTEVELSLSPRYGAVSRPDSQLRDAEIYSFDTELNWNVNDAVTLFASHRYNYQESVFEDFDAFEIPRNLYTLGVTLRLPNRNASEAVSR